MRWNRWSPYQCYNLWNYKHKIFLCSGKWNIMYKSLKMKKLTSKRPFSIHFYSNGYCTSSGWVLIGTLCPCQEIVGTKKLHYSLQLLPGHWFKVSESKRSYLSVSFLKTDECEMGRLKGVWGVLALLLYLLPEIPRLVTF